MNDRLKEVMSLLDEARHRIDGDMDCRTQEYRAIDALCRAVERIADMLVANENKQEATNA